MVDDDDYDDENHHHMWQIHFYNGNENKKLLITVSHQRNFVKLWESFQHKDCVIFQCFMIIKIDRERRIIICIVTACFHTTSGNTKSVYVKHMIHSFFMCFFPYVMHVTCLSPKRITVWALFPLPYTFSKE